LFPQADPIVLGSPQSSSARSSRVALPTFYCIAPTPSGWAPERVESFYREYNDHMIRNLTVHEAMPGHFLQLAHANRNPRRMRALLGSGTFIEGWAVYTEQMMLDQGYGDGDLALRLNQLKFYLRAVCNAILDHKMHCMNMSDKEAMDLMVNRAFQTEGEALGKVVRAKLS
jgi:uncharacterized protein (DUF885 family)